MLTVMDTEPTTSHPQTLNKRWMIIGVIVAAALVAGVALLLALRPSPSPWGMQPVKAAEKYTTCRTPVATGTSGGAARCDQVEGTYVVTTFDDRQTQEYFIAIMKDNGGMCYVSADGVVIAARTQTLLTMALADQPAVWAGEHDGESDCV